MKALGKSQPSVPASQHLWAIRTGNSQRIRSSFASLVILRAGRAGGETDGEQKGNLEFMPLGAFDSPAGSDGV